MSIIETLTAKDFASDQEVKWCPACGDYSILKQVQQILPETGIPKENTVFISGIGCSSRFPYYMNTYGMHSIHGRAPAIATGLKLTNPELDVWVITGDGDGLSIGGNHLIHALRRNINIHILLFNNEVYGLTKGQYSPTSRHDFISKTSPLGVADEPFNPLKLVLGANGSFVARGMDRDPIHLRGLLKRVQQHKGTAFLEMYQNCPIFNDGAFEIYTDKESKAIHTLFVEEGKPLVFDQGKKGILLDDLTPKVVDLENKKIGTNDLWIHEEKDPIKAQILAGFGQEKGFEHLPNPFGVIYAKERETYEQTILHQIDEAKTKQQPLSLDELLEGKNTWEIHE